MRVVSTGRIVSGLSLLVFLSRCSSDGGKTGTESDTAVGSGGSLEDTTPLGSGGGSGSGLPETDLDATPFEPDSGTVQPVDAASDGSGGDVALQEDTLPDTTDPDAVSDATSDAGPPLVTPDWETPAEEGARLASYCDLLVARYCELIFGCDEGASDRAKLVENFAISSETECLSGGGGLVRTSCLAGVEAIASGRRALGLGRSDGCGASVLAATCADVATGTLGPQLCVPSPFLVGVSPTGGGCTESLDCLAPDDLCLSASFGAPGTCSPIATGTSCLSSAMCGRGQYCAKPSGMFEPDISETGACAWRSSLRERCIQSDGCVEPAVCSPSDSEAPMTSGLCIEP
jgi:hypothetical protein